MKIALVALLLLASSSGMVRADDWPFDVRAEVREQLGGIIKSWGESRRAAQRSADIAATEDIDSVPVEFAGAADAILDDRLQAVDEAAARLDNIPLEFAGALIALSFPEMNPTSTKEQFAAALRKRIADLEARVKEAMGRDFELEQAADPSEIGRARAAAAKAKAHLLIVLWEEAKSQLDYLGQESFSALAAETLMDDRRAVLREEKSCLQKERELLELLKVRSR